MTNREFFIKTLESERPIFRSVIDAVPEDKHSHKVHDKSREAGNLASQLAIQWAAISTIITKDTPEMDMAKAPTTKSEMLKAYDQGMDQLKQDLEAVTDNDWENGDAAMGEIWKDKKYMMAWGFLFDAIHHRGQLSTFLRNMGANVPAIYGPSADARPGA
ncbi:MAG: DinB family protein [Candidatus Doudnabacteria bacterium]|nr:DinB family protein [Candidatus Doudnabacteria bacterium]